MTTQNIQIGIDLGTTNSEIAFNRNGSVEIVKNVLGDEYTPSVFGVNKAKNIEVGKPAYQKLYGEESQHYKAEVKRLMGTADTVHFSRLDKDMTAEEISAEILKSLKSDVLRKYPEANASAAVITVPAYFSTLQAEATKRAGELAGFKHVVLLQEPIAAAMAYGFNNAKNETWLIYDLGGGTFDIALISSQDGMLSVLGHNGDNFLGGKNFDWVIVDKIIVPKLLEQFALKDFSRANKDAAVQSMFGKLKRIAETAKIMLSQEAKTTLEIDIGKDDEQKDIYLTIDFSRKEFEKLIEPFITQTIDLTLDTIKEAGVKKTAVSKIILVGGPTQIPYVRERLEGALNIPIDSSVDPLTVVARGACIFASGQRVPQDLMEEKKERSNGTKEIVLHYEPMTAETESLVTGIIKDLEEDIDGYYVQIQSESGYYNSSKVKVKNGKFFDTLSLEQNKTNLFWIYLFDKKGNSIPLYPDSFSITHGLTIAGAPIPHTVGVSILDKGSLLSGVPVEKFDSFIEKGSILPAKKTKTYQTARKLVKNDTVNKLLIKVLEGDSEDPNNNDYVCELGIKGADLPHDLPEGTDIDVTISINESRELSVEYYISSVDISGNARATIRDEVIDTERIGRELNLQKVRLEKNKAVYSDEDKKKIEEEISTLETSLKNSGADEDEKRKANKQLKTLKTKMEKLEKGKEMPQLISDFNDKYQDTLSMVDNFSEIKSREKNLEHLEVLKKEGDKAITNNDKVLLARVNAQLFELGARIVLNTQQTLAYMFDKMSNGEEKFSNQQEAEYFIDKGRQAIKDNDPDELKRCVQNLMSLLSADSQRKISSNLAGITTK